MSTYQPAAKLPNILLIVMDATRARHLSCYGYHRPTTPNIERFAERAVLYETAISPSGWSLPAHASIFTGLYPSKHGADDQHKYLTPEIPTMAEVLRSRGYHTCAFCYNEYVGSPTGLNRGFEEFNPVMGRALHPMRKVARKIERGIASLLGLRDTGTLYINGQVKSKLRQLQVDERPFFLFVHYNEPHGPYRPPRRYNSYLPKGVSRRAAGQVNQDQWKYFVDPTSMTERDFEILRALYDAEITYLDSQIARVFRWLEDMGALDETLIIITADHGDNIGDHQLMGHSYCLYDTLLHVPLIIHYPNGAMAPHRVTHQVQTLDILPTILAMLGDNSSEPCDSLQGYDLLSSDRHEFTIAEQSRPDLSILHQRFPDVDVSRFDRALKMIRTDRYKYIQGSDERYELYDLVQDPEEKNNIIDENPGIANSLNQHLIDWSNSFKAASLPDEAPEFDEEVKARLRALGYLE
jgi:arylsulfatase A-like enzyme